MALWQWARIRRARVLTPRRVSQQSIGPGTAPTAFWRNRARSNSSGTEVTQGPADHVGVPAQVLGRGVDDQVGPDSRGRCRNRVAKVLSTAHNAPAAWAASAAPAMSTTPSSGLVSVSHPDQPGLGPDGLLEAESRLVMSCTLSRSPHPGTAGPRRLGPYHVGRLAPDGRRGQGLEHRRGRRRPEAKHSAPRPPSATPPARPGTPQVRPGRVLGPGVLIALVPPCRPPGRRSTSGRSARSPPHAGSGSDPTCRPGLRVPRSSRHHFAGSPIVAGQHRPARISDAPSHLIGWQLGERLAEWAEGGSAARPG